MRAMFNLFAGLALPLAFAGIAAAQQSPSPAPGTLVVEEIQSGWLLAPDVRATDFGGKTGGLAGGYLGRITDRSWVIGAGGYVLTSREDDYKLWYGGPVFEWLVRADRKIGFGVRTLVGVGGATLPMPISNFIDPRALVSSSRNSRTRDPRSGLRQIDPTATVAVRDDFFVAEPQLNVMLNLSRGHRIVFGVGYRAVGKAPWLGDDVEGVSGSISFQLGGK